MGRGVWKTIFTDAKLLLRQNLINNWCFLKHEKKVSDEFLSLHVVKSNYCENVSFLQIFGDKSQGGSDVHDVFYVTMGVTPLG